MTQIQVLSPYWHDISQCWVFDDPVHDLVREAFVLGASEMITDVVSSFENPAFALFGFRLLFSHEAFPGHQRHLKRAREESGGWWYTLEGHECWLCPALFHYFTDAPLNLYVKAEELKE